MLIRVNNGGMEAAEWALIELQGKVDTQSDCDTKDTKSSSEALNVGTMQLSQRNEGVVQLQIGYHVLEGKRVALKKPVAVLQKQVEQQGNNNSSEVVCKVVGILRHKYLFKTRPRALISKPGSISKQ